MNDLTLTYRGLEIQLGINPRGYLTLMAKVVGSTPASLEMIGTWPIEDIIEKTHAWHDDITRWTAQDEARVALYEAGLDAAMREDDRWSQ